MSKISGDSAKEFTDNANKKFGDGDLGTTDYETAYKLGGFKDGKILKLEFTCTITMDYAEVGSGKPDANNKKAIAKIADIAEAHEKRHKAGYEKAFKEFDAKKTAAALMEETYKSRADAEKAIKDAFNDLEKALNDACLNLHKKEGLIDVVAQADGSFKIIERAAGAQGCL